MLLVDSDIHLLGQSGYITPFDPDMVQPASIDVTLDKTFYIENDFTSQVVHPGEDSSHLLTKVEVRSGGEFWLHPGDFALASTYEQFEIPKDLAGRFEGKSSLGRLGLFTHITAGFIDPGFKGHITLELYNALPVPIILIPGMRIGQMCYMQLTSKPENAYGRKGVGSHYQGQRGPTPSRSHENFKIKDVYSEVSE